ncbi:MAG: hypothetical protein A3F73_04885 [Gallionellales bacterium RIFCSPLOWO2_12_FULL_59_22]|nr:MAG: hypothetical protein A3F73_04885 [Gallionellales bacterium RIFCSPLOWO2_12_FULL_59_22]
MRVLPDTAAEYSAIEKQKMKKPTFRCATHDGYPENWSITPDMNNNPAMEYAARNNQRGEKS